MSEKENNLLGYIELESIIPLTAQINIATIGGFQVKNNNGCLINFDWERELSHCFTFTKKHGDVTRIAWRLTDFDLDYFSCYEKFQGKFDRILTNELIKLIESNKLAEYICSCDLVEVFYESFIGSSKQVNIPMKLVTFEIGNCEFTEKQINKYNIQSLDFQKRIWNVVNQHYFKNYKESLLVQKENIENQKCKNELTSKYDS